MLKYAVGACAGCIIALAAIRYGLAATLVILAYGLAFLYLIGTGLAKLPKSAVVLSLVVALMSYVFGALSWVFIRGVDSLAYFQTAAAQGDERLAGSWAVSQAVLVEGKDGYVGLLAALFTIVGPSPYVAIAVNAIAFGALSISVASNSRTVKPGSETLATLGFLFVPMTLFWGGSILREVYVWLGLSLIIGAGLRFAGGSFTLGQSALGAAGFLLLQNFRGTIAVYAAGSVLLGSVLGRYASRSARSAVAAVGLLVVMQVVFLDVWSAAVSSLIDARTGALQELARADSGFAQPALNATLIVSVARVAVGPLLWETGFALWALAEFAAWIGLIWFAVRGISSVSTGARFCLLLPAANFMLLLALTSANYGGLIRLRLMLVPFLLPLAGAYLSALRDRRRARRGLLVGTSMGSR